MKASAAGGDQRAKTRCHYYPCFVKYVHGFTNSMSTVSTG